MALVLDYLECPRIQAVNQEYFWFLERYRVLIIDFVLDGMPTSSSFGTVEELFGTSSSWAARLTRFMDSEFFESKRVVINQAAILM